MKRGNELRVVDGMPFDVIGMTGVPLAFFATELRPVEWAVPGLFTGCCGAVANLCPPRVGCSVPWTGRVVVQER